MRDPRDLASFLKTSYSTFTYFFYRMPEERRYSTFHISKKNGQPRIIEAPIPPILEMQRDLAAVLQEVYRPRASVYGFIAGRNIVQNASQHSDRRWVLNIDLKDFFHSIHFGRIAAILRGWRFGFPPQLAETIAHVCCTKGRLPQGAPTSPVVSNIATDVLDKEMAEFSRIQGCKYSRYCDDISISTDKWRFPTSMVQVLPGARPRVAPPLEALIRRRMFEVNHDKTRLQDARNHQDVTGITVNDFPNVTRRRVRQVRAMLHAWRKFGLDAAQRAFDESWDKKDRNPNKSSPKFAAVVRGKIDFIGAVRGAHDPIHVRLLRQCCELDPSQRSKTLKEIELISRDVFICHASEDKEAVVRPLQTALAAAGISCFVDDGQILWGENLVRIINKALVEAKFVLVVISKTALGKNWPRKEFDSAMGAEIRTGRMRVLPLLVGPSKEARDALLKQIALIEDKRYLHWEDNAAAVAEAVADLLKRLKSPEGGAS